MYFSPLEYFEKKYGNKVVYDANGAVAGVFVRFPKMNSSELDASLPDHTHPAFIINGVEKDCIWLGKYKAGVVDDATDSPIVSLANVPPAISQPHDVLLSRVRAAGNGISGMTAADWGFLTLLAQKEGWAPEGNTNRGQATGTGTVWRTGQSHTAGTVYCYGGWRYRCLVSHTTSAEHKPDIDPAYYEKLEHIGGAFPDNERTIIADYLVPYRTINGSGPLSWCLNEDPGSLVDILGSCMEIGYGYRTVDCELQILPDNDAADPAADLSAGSGAWRAILPHAADDGYELVAPGTSGTLHWNWTGSAVQLDTQTDSLSVGYKGQIFANLTAHGTRLPHVPYIVRELGLFPTAGSTMAGRGMYYIQSGTRIVRRGATSVANNDSGLGAANNSHLYGQIATYMGCRARWME